MHTPILASGTSPHFLLTLASLDVRLNEIGVQLFGPSGGAICSSPTIDHRIYATTGDSYLDPASTTSDPFVAFDLATGRLAWSRQMTEGDAYNTACNGQYSSNCPGTKGLDFGSSPILVDLPDGRHATPVARRDLIYRASAAGCL